MDVLHCWAGLCEGFHSSSSSVKNTIPSGSAFSFEKIDVFKRNVDPAKGTFGDNLRAVSTLLVATGLSSL